MWHGNLPQHLSNGNRESVQKQALDAIYPESDDMYNVLQVAGLTTVEDRRYELCKPYINKMLNPDHKLHHLLPDERDFHHALRTHHRSCRREISNARTSRYKNSFIPWSFSHAFDFTVTMYSFCVHVLMCMLIF